MKKLFYILLITAFLYFLWSYLDSQYVKVINDKEGQINFIGDINKISFDLPVIIINTNKKKIIRGPKLPASMSIIFNPNGNSNINDKPIFKKKIAIKIRGNSSQQYPKKQYSFYTCNNIGEKENIKLFDFPKDCDWVLNGPYGDKTLIRNSMAYELASQAGILSNHTKFVEVFVNSDNNKLNGNDYVGLYLLTQKIKKAKHRINIKPLHRYCTKEPYISGGYILAIDRDRLNQSSFKTKSKTKILINYPSNDKLSWKQYNWIKNYMNLFEEALNSEHFSDPKTGFRKYIDENSFIDYLLISETLKNIDAFRLSTFLYKNRSEKIKIGPIWDYNASMGNSSYHRAYRTCNWLIYNEYHMGYQHPFWWKQLVKDRLFQQKLIHRWKELKAITFNDKNINKLIDDKVLLIKNARKRNFKKWHNVIGKRVYPNKSPYLDSYQDEITALKNWLSWRIEWIDKNIAYIGDKEKNRLIKDNL